MNLWETPWPEAAPSFDKAGSCARVWIEADRPDEMPYAAFQIRRQQRPVTEGTFRQLTIINGPAAGEEE